MSMFRFYDLDFLKINTNLLPHVEQELPTLPEHPSLTPVFSGVRVARSLVFICSVLLIIVCPFVHVRLTIVLSVHLPLCYLQTFLINDNPNQ
jgi:hypothetical protein